MTRYVYAIFVPDGVYIGRTNNVIQRIRSHGMLWCDWAVLETVENENIRKREAFWVEYFMSLGCHVLNRDKKCIDGLICHSEATRAKISIANKGKVFSEVHLQRLRESHKDRKDSPETIEKRASKIRGRKRVFSDKWRRHMSEARMGKPSPRKGQKLSPETRRKLSETHKRIGTKPPSVLGMHWKIKRKENLCTI